MSFGAKDKSNQQMVDLQREQADEARIKEQETKGRVQQKSDMLTQLFEGAPVMGQRQAQRTRQVAAPGAAPVAAPGGYVTRYSGDQDWQEWNPNAGGQMTAAAPMINENYWDTEQYDTGQRSGGFGDDFFTNYRNSIFNNLNPQINEQSEDAKRNLLFSLDNAGLMGSTEVDRGLAKWQKQKDTALADAGSKADQAAGDLRNRVNKERENLLAQIFATEGSDNITGIASNAAAALRNAPAPITSANVGFDLGTYGQAGYAGGYQTGANRFNAQRGLQPASPTQSSGKGTTWS